MWGYEEKSWYDTAEICRNGHVTNESVKEYPIDSKKFCNVCGSETIQKCESCNFEIQGYHHMPGIGSIYEKPSYCINCGEPYPWIKDKLIAAEELADIVDEFTEEDKKILSSSLQDLVRDTPRSQVAAIRFKKIVSKASENIGFAFKEILFDVATEPVNKLIWG